MKYRLCSISKLYQVIGLSLLLSGLTYHSAAANTFLKTDPPLHLKINPEGDAEYDLSELVKDVKYISLQVPEEMYLQVIRKIIVNGPNIYFFDASSTGYNAKIYSFTLDGEFNYVIDKQGRGPGEYEYIYDFDVTEKSVVLSTTTDILFYDKDSGSFVRSVHRPANPFVQMIGMLDENTMVIEGGQSRHNRSMKRIHIFDIDREEFVFESISFEKYALKAGHSYRYLFRFDDTLSVIPMYEQTVYRITQGNDEFSVRAAYRLDFHRYWIDDDFLSDSYEHRDRFFRESSNYVHTADVFETNGVIYVHYRFQNNDHTFIYDKNTGRQLDSTGFSENSIGWIGMPLGTHEDWIVNLVTPFDIEMEGMSPDERLTGKISQADDETLPILVFAKFQVR